VFIKRAGYKPTLLVLRSEGEPGQETLQPARIELELAKRAVRTTREVEIGEVDDTPANREQTSPANQSEPPASPTPPPANQPENAASPPAKPAELRADPTEFGEG